MYFLAFFIVRNTALGHGDPRQEPAPGTSSGQATMGDTEANRRSIRAMLEVSSNEETEGKRKLGKLIIDPIALAALLGELMDDKLMVSTKGGSIAMRWMADDIQEPTDKCKEDNKKCKNSHSAEAKEVKEKQDPKPTASEVIQVIDEHLELNPGQDTVQSESNPGLQGQDQVQVEQTYSNDENPGQDHVASKDVQEDKEKDPEPTSNTDPVVTTPEILVPTAPNQEQNNNQDKHLLTLESLQAQNNVQSTPDCQLVLNRVPVEFPMGPDSLALPITRGLIHDALNNLGLNLQNGALIGANPLGQWAKNMTRMPIILSFDSPETRKEVLKAGNKKNQKGPGAFPIFGEEKLYFTEMKKPRPKTNRSNTEEQVSMSDAETAEMGESLLRSQGQNRSENLVIINPEQQTGRDDGPQTLDDLANLTNQVTRIIPQSRIGTMACDGLTRNLPTEVPPGEDLRDHLNERNGIVEVEVTLDNINTVAEDILKEPESEEDLRKVLKAKSKTGGVGLTSEDFETALAKAKREMRTQEESAKLRTDVIRRLRAKLDGDRTTDEASGSDTQREPESEANNPAPKIDHHHLEEHEWNIGTDHSDFDFDDIPQESGDGMRPLAHSSPNRILTNNPVTKPVTPPAQTNQVKQRIDLYLQEREKQDEMRAANPTPNSPTTNQIDVGHPQDRPESTPRRLWKQDDEGRWYNSDVCTSLRRKRPKNN